MAAKRTQTSLFSVSPRLKDHEARREHGGKLRQGKRKVARPIDPRKPLHVTLRSSIAKGALSMLRPVNEKRIKELIEQYAARYELTILQYANSGNHLHILVRMKSREGFQRFLKTISGLIPRLVTGALKGAPHGKFWDAPAYTRIVEWGPDLENTGFYVIMNEMEAAGVWSRNMTSSPERSKSRGPQGSGSSG